MIKLLDIPSNKLETPYLAKEHGMVGKTTSKTYTTMKRRTIWMVYLTIGFLSICFLSQGCKKNIDRRIVIDYIYVNKTGHDLEMQVFNANKTQIRSYFIPNEAQIISHTSQSEVPAVLHFDDNVDMIGDSVVVRFDDHRCLCYSRYHGEYPHGDRIFDCTKYDNYSEELLSKNAFSLYFTFTEEDYDISSQCE